MNSLKGIGMGLMVLNISRYISFEPIPIRSW